MCVENVSQSKRVLDQLRVGLLREDRNLPAVAIEVESVVNELGALDGLARRDVASLHLSLSATEPEVVYVVASVGGLGQLRTLGEHESTTRCRDLGEVEKAIHLVVSDPVVDDFGRRTPSHRSGHRCLTAVPQTSRNTLSVLLDCLADGAVFRCSPSTRLRSGQRRRLHRTCAGPADRQTLRGRAQRPES